MRRKRYTVCTTDGCPVLVQGGRRCKDCEAKADKQRPNSTARGYDRKWRLRRARFLLDHPICEEQGCHKASTDVHHRIKRKDLIAQGVQDPDADQYLQALCHSHHSQQTSRGN